MEQQKIYRRILVLVFSFVLGLFSITPIKAYADDNPTLYSDIGIIDITLAPGEIKETKFNIFNNPESKESTKYHISTYRIANDNEETDNAVNVKEDEDLSKWISLDKTEGEINPGEGELINLSVTAPQDAPYGGRTASLTITADEREQPEIIILIYATIIDGNYHDEENQASIKSASVPSIIVSENIKGTANVSNQSPFYVVSSQRLIVYPLFSEKPLYDNNDRPNQDYISPGTNNQTTSIEVANTPSFGIFHVIYSAELGSTLYRVDKYVVVFPWWLILIVGLAVAVIIWQIIVNRKIH